MADVKWIKIVTDIFDDEKIKLIEALPSADTIIVIWFKLLCLAGQQNNAGVFMLNSKIAYTDEMLSAIFRRDISSVRLAISTFQQYGMVEVIDDVLTIPNWDKYQTLDAYERKKERDRIYQRERREKQRKLISVNGSYTLDEFLNLQKQFNFECAYCGSKEEITPDHVVPIAKNGSTTIDNIVPCCRRCNSSKGMQDMETWYRKQPFFDEERLKKILTLKKSYDIGRAFERDCSYSYSNIINNNIKEDNSLIIKNIISYLNKVCNTRYRHNTDSTKKLIKARLNEGFTEDDFKAVIDKKFAQWGNDPKMSEYLRPQTLFGTKFESYLNQKMPDGSMPSQEEDDDAFAGFQ